MKLGKLLARLGLAAVLLSTLNLQLSTAFAQGTAFTYQGLLSQNGSAINGSNDLTFTLYTAVSGGGIVGTSNVVNDLVLTNGFFTVTLDFGPSPFIGSDRWLQIAVRPGASTGAYTVLAPRQPITATPYALFAAAANASTLIGSIPSTSLSGTYNVAVTLNNAGNVFAGIGSNLTALNASQLTSGTVPAAALSNAWKTTGNAGTTPGTHFFGTTDNQPLEFKVNGQRGLRLEYASSGLWTGVNVIGGYNGNSVGSAVGATVFGGGVHVLGSSFKNQATADFATVGGGHDNTASGNSAVVGGGQFNTASGNWATVGGGQGNHATGERSTIPGGNGNVATDYAFAAGKGALANHQGAFVWADSVSGDFASTANNQFSARASGGVRFVTGGAGLTVDGGNVGIGTTSPMASIGYPGGWDGLHSRSTGNGLHIIHGVGSSRLHLRTDNNITNISQDFIIANGANQIDFMWLGGGLANRLNAMTINTNGNLTVAGTVTANGVLLTSDRNAKENFKPVSAAEVLRKVAALPITEWNYKNGPADVRHVGPMAQDFHAAFGLNGGDDKHVSVVDETGVALAAIQGLNQKLETENAALKARLEKLERLVQKLAGE